jgi:pimeloyl-ACP methyl ester carboxylesterase
MLPYTDENSKIIRGKANVPLDDEGNYIHELNFQIVNHRDFETKHVVFIHGYGASLGCFARNFQLINKFSDKNFNYKIHFLDNITFGLSSNPKVKNDNVNHWFIKKCPPIKLIDTKPTVKSQLHNKYYKLIDGYKIDKQEFDDYQKTFIPILKDLEHFYTSAIDNWRKSQNLDKIDYLVGHSFGGYWSASYSLKYPAKLHNLILLSPVGVERHVHSVNNKLEEIDDSQTNPIKPSLDPTKFNFLSRYPILSEAHIREWYWKLPFLPRFLKFFGPLGYSIYYKMWFSRLFKINKVLKSIGDKKTLSNANDLVYGTTKECKLIIEYLFNSITNGTNSDIYVKNLLTPATVSKWPIYDKFETYLSGNPQGSFNIDIVYGQYDFMNGEAGEKLVNLINEQGNHKTTLHKIREGGHNLYIDNPWDTNQLIHDIVERESQS